MSPARTHERRPEDAPGVLRSPAGLALLGCVLAAGVHIALIKPLLPDRVATHFNLSGEANGWMSRDGFLVFYAVFIVLFAAFLAGIALALPRLSNAWINMPHKEYWLAPERRAESLAWAARWIVWLDVISVLFLIAVMQDIVSTNTGGRPLGGAFWVTGGAFMLVFVVGIVRMLRRFPRPPAEPGAPRRAAVSGRRS